MGDFDVLVGINLLREGLDLPEVSLVSHPRRRQGGLPALGTSLIQTIGRAARNVSGQVHMYADKITPSMAAGDRRDQPAPGQAGRLQRGEHGVDPQPLRKKIADITDLLDPRGRRHRGAASGGRAHAVAAARRRWRRRRGAHGRRRRRVQRTAGRRCPAAELADLIQQLTDQMHQAAAELQFELAARLRDEIGELKKELRQMSAATR